MTENDLQTLLVWVSHDRFWSIVIPKHLLLFTMFIGLLLMDTFCIGPINLFLEIVRSWHFAGWMVREFLHEYLCNLSAVLIIFGAIIINGVVGTGTTSAISIVSTSLFSSYSSVFLLTISSPMTIVFFTSIFSAKAIEYNYSKHELLVFGLATGLATFIFMGSSVVLFSLMSESIPLVIIQVLNVLE